MKRWFWLAAAAPALLFAQSPLTVEQAVQLAAERYPSVKASLEQVSAAAAGINLSRTSYLPRVDAIAQVNRASLNNVYGMLLQQPVISPISGPPVTENRSANVFGSAVGFLVNWEPFDFGQRKGEIGVSEASKRKAEAGVERTKFDVSAAAADAFLTVLAAEQQVRAAESGVKRAEIFHTAVDAMARAGLRPGADAARAKAEVAMARTQLIQAKQAYEVARVSLAYLVGSSVSDLRIDGQRLLGASPADEAPAAAAHPAMKEQSAAIDEVRSRQKSLDRAFFPRFNIQGTTYARGTGAKPDFTTLGGANGLAPNYYNWGIGFSVLFPIMDYKAIGEKKRIEAAHERVEQAKLSQVQLELDTRQARARATLDGARQVAANIPVQLEAARAAEQQASARYRTGLGTIAEVAEAQRLLTQTEIDDALAKLGEWRGLLAVAAAQGSLESFLKAAR
jgi:outer membrane protein TolC